MNNKKAIALLSGGLDSTVATSYYANDYEIYGLFINYSQKSLKKELESSENIAKKLGFKLKIIDLKWLADVINSSLTNEKEVPTLNSQDLDDLELCKKSASSVWVPGRNILFTSIATSYAESIGAEIIIVGWDKEEAETFPDNSKEFLDSYNKMLKIASPYDIEVKAPAIDLNKDEIVKLGNKINAPMELSYSCYDNGNNHCGVCESCIRRKRAFELANVSDLTIYEK